MTACVRELFMKTESVIELSDAIKIPSSPVQEERNRNAFE
jgi:hypothetical protein